MNDQQTSARKRRQPITYNVIYPSGQKFRFEGYLGRMDDIPDNPGIYPAIDCGPGSEVWALDPRGIITVSGRRAYGPRDFPLWDHALWVQAWLAEHPEWDQFGNLTSRDVTELRAALEREGVPLAGRPAFLMRQNGAILNISQDGPLPASASPIEVRFWDTHRQLRLPALAGLVPQHPAHGFRIDFALPERKIGIELDGFASHSSTADIAKDRRRQRLLEGHGWYIIRFGGSEVHHDAEGCARQAAYLAEHAREGGSG